MDWKATNPEHDLTHLLLTHLLAASEEEDGGNMRVCVPKSVTELATPTFHDKDATLLRITEEYISRRGLQTTVSNLLTKILETLAGAGVLVKINHKISVCFFLVTKDRLFRPTYSQLHLREKRDYVTVIRCCFKNIPEWRCEYAFDFLSNEAQ